VSCPDELLSAFVDGEVDHETREKVLSHLLDCVPCRLEVDGLRSLKTRPAARASAPPRPRRTTRLRRRTAGGCIVALGLTAAFVLGGPATSRDNEVKVDPGTEEFVADYVDSTVEVPLTDPVDAAVVGTFR
jgi:anti-sigma factor RsiW